MAGCSRRGGAFLPAVMWGVTIAAEDGRRPQEAAGTAGRMQEETRQEKL